MVNEKNRHTAYDGYLVDLYLLTRRLTNKDFQPSEKKSIEMEISCYLEGLMEHAEMNGIKGLPKFDLEGLANGTYSLGRLLAQIDCTDVVYRKYVGQGRQ